MIFGTKLTLTKALFYINGFLNQCRLHEAFNGGENLVRVRDFIPSNLLNITSY